MFKPETYNTIRERSFAPHELLLEVAENALKREKQNEIDSSHQWLIAVTFSSLAIEALCNYVGEKFIQNWKDFESSSAFAKLRVIANELNLPIYKDSEPFATIISLGKFRNLIAHPKPEFITKQLNLRTGNFDAEDEPAIPGDIEKHLTQKMAQRAFDAVIQLRELLLNEKERTNDHV